MIKNREAAHFFQNSPSGLFSHSTLPYLCRMPKILLIETATAVCSVALSVGDRLLAQVEEPVAASHAALLTVQIEQCMHESGLALADLDAVAVSQGPGAYTSLRVGASVAKGICYALDKPLIAVDTLEALAWASLEAATDGAQSVRWAAPMVDARRQEVWTAVYDADLRLLLPAQPLIVEHNSFEKMLENLPEFEGIREILVSGSGTKKTSNGIFKNLTVTHSEIIQCSAAYLQRVATRHFLNKNFVDAAYFEPFYMKPPNITTEKAKI